MSLKSTVAYSLVGGAAGFGAVLWGLMHLESYRRVELANRMHDISERLYSGSNRSPAEEQRRWKSAESEYRDLLADWTRLKGADFVETLNCREELAYALTWEGNPEEAEAQYRTALRGMDRTLTPNNTLTLAMRDRFANALERMGKYDEAEVELRKMVQAWSAMNRAPSLQLRHELRDSLDHQEKFEEELKVLQAELEEMKPLADAQRRGLGERSAGMQMDYRRREEWIQALIQFVEARAEAKQAYEEAKKKWGENHPETRALRAQLESLKKQQPYLPKKPAGG